MRYSININQYALTNMKSKIKFEEAVLLDYIFWLCTSPSKEVAEMRKEIDGNVYTGFDYNYYIKETPMAKGRTKPTLTPKIRLLEEEQGIETRLVQTGNGERKYVRILEKCDSLLRNLNDPVKKTKRTPLRNLNIDNNTIKNNTNIDNNISNSEELQKDINNCLSFFDTVNTTNLYKNTTERKRMGELLETKPRNKLNYILKNLDTLSQDKFFPLITKPSELLSKGDKAVLYLTRSAKEPVRRPNIKIK